jgi:hypothetical protein
MTTPEQDRQLADIVKAVKTDYVKVGRLLGDARGTRRHRRREVCPGRMMCAGSHIICHYLPDRRRSGLPRLVYVDGHGVMYDRYGAAGDLDDLDTEWQPVTLSSGEQAHQIRQPLEPCGITECPPCAHNGLEAGQVAP